MLVDILNNKSSKVKIWADANIQKQLDKTHKDSEVLQEICEYLLECGYQASFLKTKGRLMMS